MMRWRNKFTEQIGVKMFLQKLREYESGGFIASDVWSDIRNYVDSDTVASTSNTIAQVDNNEEREHSDEPSSHRLLSCVARYVLDSRAFHFAIEVLGLPAYSYQVEENKNPDDKHLMKFEVCHTK